MYPIPSKLSLKQLSYAARVSFFVPCSVITTTSKALAKFANVGLERAEKLGPKNPRAQLISLLWIRDWLLVRKTGLARAVLFGKLELHASWATEAL